MAETGTDFGTQTGDFIGSGAGDFGDGGSLPVPPSPAPQSQCIKTRMGQPPVPFFPPFGTYVLPRQPFEAMIANSGTRLNWRKAHSCPCVMTSFTPGSPDPACQNCGGHGVYWDPPVGPFVGLITFMHMAPSPDEPGVVTDTSFGQNFHGEPVITIPFAGGPNASTETNAMLAEIWAQATIYDAFVEVDALERFNTVMTVGQTQVTPYQQSLSIASSGAVTAYDAVNHIVVPVSGYTVSGAAVYLPSSYATGVAYTVEFYAAPVWVLYRRAGGIPHVRPFGGMSPVNEPRRFRAQSLDWWTRANSNFPISSTPQSPG